ncbi:MAG: GNAT family N-acetyltransferase [Sphingobacteriales bacterium]|nr:GNAT family N-acetyltransferase [Sphingobacteriales bacterium]
MSITITPAQTSDLPEIYRLFEQAIQFQRERNYIGWNNYDKGFIQEDIRNKQLYKILNGEFTLGIFSVCYADPLIWRDMEKNDALYLHRIVLNREFRGIKLFSLLLDWALEHARQKKLKHLRMDTWAGNEKLISYYKSYGFRFIENYTTENTEELPEQHRNLKVALLELTI